MSEPPTDVALSSLFCFFVGKNKETNREERATSGGGSDQDPKSKSGDVAQSRPARDRGRVCRKLECDDDAVYYYIGERLELEGETEIMGVCTKERERHDSRGTHGHSLLH